MAAEGRRAYFLRKGRHDQVFRWSRGLSMSAMQSGYLNAWRSKYPNSPRQSPGFQGGVPPGAGYGRTAGERLLEEVLSRPQMSRNGKLLDDILEASRRAGKGSYADLKYVPRPQNIPFLVQKAINAFRWANMPGGGSPYTQSNGWEQLTDCGRTWEYAANATAPVPCGTGLNAGWPAPFNPLFPSNLMAWWKVNGPANQDEAATFGRVFPIPEGATGEAPQPSPDNAAPFPDVVPRASPAGFPDVYSDYSTAQEAKANQYVREGDDPYADLAFRNKTAPVPWYPWDDPPYTYVHGPGPFRDRKFAGTRLVAWLAARIGVGLITETIDGIKIAWDNLPSKYKKYYGSPTVARMVEDLLRDGNYERVEFGPWVDPHYVGKNGKLYPSAGGTPKSGFFPGMAHETINDMFYASLGAAGAGASRNLGHSTDATGRVESSIGDVNREGGIKMNDVLTGLGYPRNPPRPVRTPTPKPTGKKGRTYRPALRGRIQ